jgi:hypothetical protein
VNLARLVSEALTIALGFYFLWAGYRSVGDMTGISPKDAKRRARRRSACRALGIFTIVVACMNLVWFPSARVVDPDSLKWQAVATTDGVLTVKMPGTPEVQYEDHDGENGPTRRVKQLVALDRATITFSLMERHYLDKDIKFDRNLFLDASAKALIAQTKGRLSGEREVHLGGAEGKEMTIRIANGCTVVTQLFQIGKCAYQLIVVTPDAMAGSSIVREFLESLVVSQGDQVR